jgi:hypothetical protein
MQRGVKMEPKPTKAKQIETLDKELQNLQMAGRVTQMMLQQVMQNMQNLGKDLGKSLGIINELQYKILAMQSVGNFDESLIAKRAEELRLNDFNEASNAEDVAGNFTVGDVVQEDSTVIVTSTTVDNSESIFRSRIKLADCGVPILIQGLTGQPVGTKVACKLNNVDHVIELLAIRNPLPSVKIVPVGDPVVEVDGSVSQDYARDPASEAVH